MSGKFRSSRIFHVLLLVAFVYQLNVCPCGCLEHNGWFLVGNSLLQSVSLTAETGREQDSRSSKSSFDDFHCDANGPAVFITENRGNNTDSRLFVPADSGRKIAETIHRSSAPSFSLAMATDCFSGCLTVRANFQVFLI